MLKAGLPAQGDGRWFGTACGKSDADRRRSILLTGVAVAALLSGANAARAADINNTSPFVSNGAFFGDVISNTSTVTNNTGTWTGNIRSNANQITNNAGATWNGGIQTNNSQITNHGTWLNGAIAGNGDPANPLPDPVGSKGWIFNSQTGTWYGDVNGNSDFVMNAGGAWFGNINGNANYVLNNGGTWTGNVVGNSGYGQFTQVFNGGNALWVGDVVGNGAFVGNDGAWQGSVLGNSRTLQNSGTWTGNVAGNSGNLYNFTGTWNGNVLANGGTIFNRSTNVLATWNGNVNGNTGSIQNQTGSRWNGDVTGNAGTIDNNAGAAWTGNVTGNAGIIINNATWTGTVANAGAFTNAAGATVSGLVTNSGITSNAGTLSGGLTNTAGVTTNTGTIAGTTTVNGGTLTGTGSVFNLAIGNGGIFAPGNVAGSSMAVTGNLALSSGAQYLVQTSATSSQAIVTGTATPGNAAVRALYANGAVIVRESIILTAGAVAGTFGSVSTNLPAGFTASLRHDTTHAYIDIALGLGGSSSGLDSNQSAVADAMLAYFNRTGSIPIEFGALTPAALTQAAGEAATGSQQATFGAMTRFMDLLLDQTTADGDRSGSAPLPYAASETPRRDNARDAFASLTKAPSPIEGRWSLWAAGYGGWQTTDGNATQGSSGSTSRIYGTAMGADYRFSPDTVAGVALAAGVTGFDVNGSGSGHSDLFQAGAFVRHTAGRVYLAAALAYGWQDITTNRTLTIVGVDQLRARFNANAFSGRIESGYRLAAPWAGGIGITPYAALQATAFDLPAYAEAAISGANTFALSYGAQRVTNTRSELGLRTDKSYALAAATLTLRGRLAWAHDYDPERGAAPTFQALPGASFVVNGAAQAPNSALMTAAVEMKWGSGWSAVATFDGEFSSVTRSYAGKGGLRYAW